MTADGNAPGGPGPVDDRVRACPGCGEIVPFVERSCPSCGHHDPLGLREQPGLPCPHCGQEMAAQGLFCGHCGREREVEPAISATSASWQAETGGQLNALVLATTLLGPLTLLAAVLAVYA